MKLFANSCVAILVTCLSLAGGLGFARAAGASPAPEVKVVRAGDVELHYVEQGNGVPVIFVHGSVDDYRSFEPAFTSRAVPFSSSMAGSPGA